VRKWAFGVFLLAAGLRVVLSFFLPPEGPLILDQASYNALGLRILHGQSYALVYGGSGLPGLTDSGPVSPVYHPFLSRPDGPTAVYPPAYPVLLAGIYAVFGESHLAARVANALLWGLAAVLLMLLAVRAGLSRFSAVAGALLLAVCPPHLELSGFLLSENLFTPLMIGAALLLLVAFERSRAWALGSGLAMGLGCLARPSALGLVLVFAVSPFLFRVRRAWLVSGWLLLGVGVAVGPWVLRNHAAFGRPFLVSTAGGRSLYLTATGIREAEEIDSLTAFLVRKGIDQDALYQSLDEAQIDDLYRKMATEAFARDPGRALGVVALNPLRFAFNMPYPGGHPSGRTWVYAIFAAVIFLLAGVALFRSKARYRWLLGGTFLYFLAFHTVMSPAFVRYSLPAIVLLFPLAVSGVFYLILPGTRWKSLRG